MRRQWIVMLLVGAWAGILKAEPPKVLDERLELTVVAEAPQIVTPTGIACDERGRVFVLECHTHFRPKDYQGPQTDRVRIFEDTDGDGKFEKVTTFAEGFQAAMGICLDGPQRAYVATRSDVHLLEDTDDDGRADKNTQIVRLDTAGNYPHNGLSSVTLDPLGHLYFSLGENLGAAYQVIGADKSTLSGGGEGGNIYRCHRDGTKLQQVATGFWNTFGLGFDAFGNLFAVDNDPDSRPPCRLLHIVEGGDYGYRFRNGRKGVHPFTAWNGELPGTLPMVCGTGEAPSGVLAYESVSWPKEYLGKLLVTSWGDHRLDVVELTPRGASYGGRLKPLVTGGDDFRPVCLALGPDGSVYFTDWVLKDYPLHGKGRVWRLQAKARPALVGHKPSELARSNDAKLLNSQLASRDVERRRAAARRLVSLDKESEFRINNDDSRIYQIAMLELLWANAHAGKMPIEEENAADLLRFWSELGTSLFREIVRHASVNEAKMLAQQFGEHNHPHIRLAILHRMEKANTTLAVKTLVDNADDPFLVSAAVRLLARTEDDGDLKKLATDPSPRLRLAALLALRTRPGEPAPALIEPFLSDADAGIRRAAMQWVAEAGLKSLSGALETSLARGATPEIFQTYLAARERLGDLKRPGKDEFSGQQFALALFLDPGTDPALRRLALRSVSANDPGLKGDELARLLAGDNPGLRREIVWTLRETPRKETLSALTKIVGDSQGDVQLRADSVDALATLALTESAAGDALRQIAAQDKHPLQRHAQRGLTAKVAPAPLTAEKVAALRIAVRQPGDLENGRRIFFQRTAAACSQCHRVDGRGGVAGPDLSKVAGHLTEERLLDSIFEPSKEIAPQFVTWVVTTTDGRTLTGILHQRDAQGNLTLADIQGKLHEVRAEMIDEMTAAKNSLMPDRLFDALPVDDFRDLLAFLKALK